MASGDCVRCRKPAIQNGLCAEHLALGADPRSDSDGEFDHVKQARVYGHCDCGAALTWSHLQVECDGCRRRQDPPRRCDCVDRTVLKGSQKMCDPCRWAAVLGARRLLASEDKTDAG